MANHVFRAPATPQMTLLSLQKGEDSTWAKPRLLFLKVTGNEEPATTPMEIAKTLTRLPHNVRELMLQAIDEKNLKRSDSQIWVVANLWTWSKKPSETQNEDPVAALLDVIAYLKLEQDQDRLVEQLQALKIEK
ncbi:hypothetical protein TWF481_010373 [Arthrobotrys musiformis]|uniref:Uncharacterized protein n=1 Tax=Arthrobotrys musiformis TaxID=47236 RepID=A0AAV9W1Z7_9PEZI